MSRPIPSTFGTYKPGIGFTITRDNIEAFQQQLVEDNKPTASAQQIVLAFATATDRNGHDDSYNFQHSKLYKRRLARCMKIMANPKRKK